MISCCYKYRARLPNTSVPCSASGSAAASCRRRETGITRTAALPMAIATCPVRTSFQDTSWWTSAKPRWCEQYTAGSSMSKARYDRSSNGSTPAPTQLVPAEMFGRHPSCIISWPIRSMPERLMPTATTLSRPRNHARSAVRVQEKRPAASSSLANNGSASPCRPSSIEKRGTAHRLSWRRIPNSRFATTPNTIIYFAA